jgi:acetone carboxylase gamma subunit
MSESGEDVPAWEQKAHENVQKWGLQPVDALLLAMGEEMGELAGEVHGMADYPDASGEGARMAEQGRDLIRRMDQLGRDIRDYLETVSEDVDGNPIPEDERPNYLDPFPEDLKPSRRARLIRSELDDLMALGYQFLWALETDTHEVRTDGGVEPSAFSYTLTDEDPDTDALTVEYVSRFAALNPELRLESATFRVMTDGTEDGLHVPEFPATEDGAGDGLRSKYTVLKDGEPQSGCFVLKPGTDPAAREALSTYADATGNESLEQDLNQWLDSLDAELETDGGEDVLRPEDVGEPSDEEMEQYRKRREMFTCPDCGEVADARVDATEVGQLFWKVWAAVHTVESEDGGREVYVHFDEDEVDRGRELRELLAPGCEDVEVDPREDPSHGDDRPDLDAYHRQQARERRPRTDGGEDVDWTEQYATTTYRGPQKYPVPGAWVLGMVEMDGIGWKHYPDAGEGASHGTDVMDAMGPDEYSEGPDARASLISDHPDGADVMTDPPYHELKINGELVMVLKDASEVPEADWWRAIAEALARYDSGGEYETVLSDLGLEHLKADPYGASEPEDSEDADRSLDEFVPASSLETDGEPGGGA